MKIGFDAKRAFHNRSGLGNYSRHIISALGRSFANNQYYLFTPAPKLDYDFQQEAPRASCSLITPQQFLHTQFSGLWRSTVVASEAKKLGVDLFHGLSNELPSGLHRHGIRSVVTIHDLIFLRFPELYPWVDRQIYKRKFRSACEQADAIVAISRQTAEDIEYYFQIPKERIVLIGQDCNPIYHTPATDARKVAVQSKYQLPDRFVFCVGTIEKRKNQLVLLKAIERLEDASLAVVFVGGSSSYRNQIDQYLERSTLKQRVRFLEKVPVEDLSVLYQLATVFAYPSLFEGFGIPILEAMNSGVPVITSSGSCFAETGGEAALYVDPKSEEALASQLRLVLNDTELRLRMISGGKVQALKFREEIIASQLMNLYQTLVN